MSKTNRKGTSVKPDETEGAVVAEIGGDERRVRDLYAEMIGLINILPVPDDINQAAQLYAALCQKLGERLGVRYGADIDYQRMGFRLEVVPVLRLVQTAPEAQ